jgi:MoaA/NifB/PqqE/SkfB family radical SAM enzyme
VAGEVASAIYEENLRLGQIEHLHQHIYLRSLPRCLGLVLGNGCNIDCPHCYQAKNGDNLLKPAGIGREFRREFAGFYPYLSTLRIQGGEAFAFAGFAELIEDVAAGVKRPILSVSTNGTLIDESWAERIVRAPFRNITVSIDGSTSETYARLRRGADLDQVLANVGRIRRWKEKLASDMPYLDSFFVVMRSNFRELPQYFDLMGQHGFSEISLQTMELNRENTSREPMLAHDEAVREPAEVAELYALLRDRLPHERRRFRSIRTSGLTSLFQNHGFDPSFLNEENEGFYPDSADLRVPEPISVPLCPNPWTTLFVAENGDVHLCFLSEPVGNLYEAPLASIWNAPRALAKRSQMISGRYRASGCSPLWCSWRDGEPAAPPASADLARLQAEMRELADRAERLRPLVQLGERSSGIAAVRRMVADRERRINELESIVVQLYETNRAIHEKGRKHIDHLETANARAVAHLAHLETKTEKAVADYERRNREFEAFRRQRFIRLADRLRSGWLKLKSQFAPAAAFTRFSTSARKRSMKLKT